MHTLHIVRVVGRMPFSMVVGFITLLRLEYDKECAEDGFEEHEEDLRIALTDALFDVQVILRKGSSSERQTKKEFMDYEYEYATHGELALALLKEARVCGDDIRWPEGGNSAEIFNFHQMSVRWKGTVKE